jgi:hypothetical protein
MGCKRQAQLGLALLSVGLDRTVILACLGSAPPLKSHAASPARKHLPFPLLLSRSLPSLQQSQSSARFTPPPHCPPWCRRPKVLPPESGASSAEGPCRWRPSARRPRSPLQLRRVKVLATRFEAHAHVHSARTPRPSPPCPDQAPPASTRRHRLRLALLSPRILYRRRPCPSGPCLHHIPSSQARI